MVMFKRRNTPSKTQNIDTLIGAGTRILGDIQFTGGLHVDGRVLGNIEAIPGANATLSISDSGEVEGSVHAPQVMLNGRVVGDITAEKRVELGSTAKVTGNVYYGIIEMALGAQINGKLMHQAQAAVGSEAAPAQTPASDPAADADAA